MNTIAVRWMPARRKAGGMRVPGIYRHTWLVKRNPVHIETDGVYANPVRNADGNWSIPIEVALYSSDNPRPPG